MDGAMNESDGVYVGVDENGLGPRLGPLVVTAVLARASAEGAKLIGKRPRGGLASRLGDSKRLVSFEDSGLGGAWAVAMARRESWPRRSRQQWPEICALWNCRSSTGAAGRFAQRRSST